jgi:hypothetical protein
MAKFKWTDKKVLKFVKIAMSGQYGEYKGKKTANDKLKHYKKLLKKIK